MTDKPAVTHCGCKVRHDLVGAYISRQECTFTQLQQQLASLRELLTECCEADKAAQLLKAREQITSLELHLAQVRSWVDDESSTWLVKCEDLYKAKRELESRVAELLRQVAQAGQDLSDKQAHIQWLEAQLKAKDERIADLESKMRSLQPVINGAWDNAKRLGELEEALRSADEAMKYVTHFTLTDDGSAKVAAAQKLVKVLLSPKDA